VQLAVSRQRINLRRQQAEEHGVDPTLVLGAAGTMVALALVWAFRRRTAGRREDLEVVFELVLPSKWAAELTAQTLANDGITSRVVRKSAGWTCYVRKRMGKDRSGIDAACQKLDQIAAARGGGCAAHRLKLGSKEQTFEH
jgi:hypothetical protein